MPHSFFLLVGLILAVAVLSFVAWISLQSLLQARLLYRIRALRRGPGPDGRFALHGRVRVDRPLRLEGVGDVLWLRMRHQVYRRSGRSTRWVTVRDEKEMAGFSLTADGRDVLVAEEPTEVQAVVGSKRYEEPAGCLFASSDRRVLIEHLPVEVTATAVGRLERRGEGWRLVRDNKVGLLLSPREPEWAGFVELLKGAGGLAAVTAAVGAGIWFYYARF